MFHLRLIWLEQPGQASCVPTQCRVSQSSKLYSDTGHLEVWLKPYGTNDSLNSHLILTLLWEAVTMGGMPLMVLLCVNGPCFIWRNVPAECNLPIIKTKQNLKQGFNAFSKGLMWLCPPLKVEIVDSDYKRQEAQYLRTRSLGCLVVSWRKLFIVGWY